MNYILTYAELETQQAFEKLPKNDQNILKAAHEMDAYTINDAISKRSGVILGNPDIVEHDNCIEMLGHLISKENYGAPTCPSIKINPERPSYTEPHAVSLEKNGETYWFYNFAGANVEAKFRNEHLPSIEELLKVINAIPGDKFEKAKKLNLPFISFYTEDADGIDLWTSTEPHESWEEEDSEDHEKGSVRLLKNTANEVWEDSDIIMAVRSFLKK